MCVVYAPVAATDFVEPGDGAEDVADVAVDFEFAGQSGGADRLERHYAVDNEPKIATVVAQSL